MEDLYVKLYIMKHKNLTPTEKNIRVKSGKFGRTAKFGQQSCLIHILII